MKPSVGQLADFATKMQAGATPVALASPWHGPAHWKDVARFASKFARAAGGDPIVAFVFGAIHDTLRENDYHDPGHGLRAARKVFAIRQSDLFWMTNAQIRQLTYALVFHDIGEITDDPTIGACWDGDRVTLWRVETRPWARLMSTSFARVNPEQARGDLMKDDLTWKEIAQL